MNAVYVKLNDRRDIINVNSDFFLTDITGWVKVDEGDGDRYCHAQNNYLPKPLITQEGKYQYSLNKDGQIIEQDTSPDLEELKAAKRAEIAAARYAEEISGITLYGAQIRTDRESQALITGAALAATIDENYAVTWKVKNGFVTLTAEQIVAVAQAVRMHVEACFNQEAELQAEIDAAVSAEEVAAITWITEDA